MPFGSVTLKPGVVAEYTPTLNTASYQTSTLGRFRAGLFEKLGGWTAWYPFTVGVPRAVQAWQDFNGVKRLAVGATTAVTSITSSGLATTITPQTLDSNFSPNFTTTLGSNIVTITDTNISNVTTLDSIEFRTPVSIGGLILSGVYAINLIISSTQYRILASANATAAVSNAGAVPSFTTTNGSSTVSVTLASHGLSVGSTIVFPISTSVGGVTIQGTYTVVGVSGANVFSISASQAATSGATVSMNGGNAGLRYYIAIGPASANGTGWGVDGWGVVPWGGTGAPPSGQTGTPVVASDYTLDNWGETLLACPANGGIYQWGPNSGFQNMQLVATAPIYASGMFVSSPAQILIAYGSAVQKTIGLSQDPLTYAWSDQLDYTYWTPSVTNPSTGKASQAGSNRIPTGSAIVAGMQAPQQTLLWTDIELWSINYLGPPLVFGQNKIGSNCGTIGRHAVAQMNGIVYWWGKKNFYQLAGGAPQVIPCSVWDVVFQDLDTNNLDKCWIETVSSFQEVWFFYPSASGGTGQCDSYVKFNAVDQTWDYGALPRAAGIDQSLLGNPIMGDPQGLLWQHETGYNANGQPLIPSFSTGYFYLSEGEDYVFVDQFLPDFKWGLFNGAQTASVLVSFSVIDFPGDTPRVFGPYTMTSATDKLDVRFRGRMVAITMTGQGLDNYWRLGKCHFRFAQDGRR